MISSQKNAVITLRLFLQRTDGKLHMVHDNSSNMDVAAKKRLVIVLNCKTECLSDFKQHKITRVSWCATKISVSNTISDQM